MIHTHVKEHVVCMINSSHTLDSSVAGYMHPCLTEGKSFSAENKEFRKPNKI